MAVFRIKRLAVQSTDEIDSDSESTWKRLQKTGGGMVDLDKDLHDQMIIDLFASLDTFMLEMAIDHMAARFHDALRKMIEQESHVRK